jgi:hypothetical protein
MHWILILALLESQILPVIDATTAIPQSPQSEDEELQQTVDILLSLEGQPEKAAQRLAIYAIAVKRWGTDRVIHALDSAAKRKAKP